MSSAADASTIDDEDEFLYGGTADASAPHVDREPSDDRSHVPNASLAGSGDDMAKSSIHNTTSPSYMNRDTSAKKTSQVWPQDPASTNAEPNDTDEYDSDDSDVEFIIDPNEPLVPPQPPQKSVSYAPEPATASGNTISTSTAISTATPAGSAAAVATEAGAAPIAPREPLVRSLPDEHVAPIPSPAPAFGATTMAQIPERDDVRSAVAPAPAAGSAASVPMGPEGPPPAAPSTGPELHLDPQPSDLTYPPSDPLFDARTETEKADDPPPMSIYQVDIDSLPEKPWRRPGANLSDWFNYGFDEQTWAMWCGKKHRMEQTREAELVPAEPVAPPVAPPMPFMPELNSMHPHLPQDRGMPDFSALLAPGGMMNMPPPMQAWPMMRAMMPPSSDHPSSMPMPMPPLHPDMHGMDWPEPRKPDSPSHVEPAYEPSYEPPRSPQDGQRVENGAGPHPDSSQHDAATEHLNPISHTQSQQQQQHHRTRPSSDSNRSERRRADHDTDSYAASHDTHQVHSPRYNDRDMVHGMPDALDYGVYAEDARRARRSTHHTRRDASPADDYDPEQFGRPPLASAPSSGSTSASMPTSIAHHAAPGSGSGPGPGPGPGSSHRERPNRRDRDRARHDRRLGRGGGQKRGAPDTHEEERDYSSKRAHHGSSRIRRDA